MKRGRRAAEPVENFDPAALRHWRATRGLSHDALCGLVNVDRSNLIAYEQGRQRPGIDVHLDLARALGVEPLALTTSGPDGPTLADLRLRAGVSRADVAARLGLARNTWYAIERGERGLRPAVAAALAEMLGATEAEVVAARDRGAAGRGTGPRHRAAPGAGRDQATTPLARLRRLPAPRHPLLGRNQALVSVGMLLGRTRLVTLVGPPGVGKSRLALEVAALLAPEYADGACWVELAPVARPELATAAVATALGVREDPGRALADAVAHALGGRRLLVVLDNCEHLLEASGRLALGLLDAGAEVSVLATSREPLGVTAERAWAVPPLPVPGPTEAAASDPAVALFADRAGLACPGFALDAATTAVVAEICRRLDGVPLAIELAAARLGALSPAEIAASLDEGFDVVVGEGARAAPGRHQTLEQAVAWSYRLLDDAERSVLRRLSVFAGGATADAARAVCSGGPVGAGRVGAVLAALVDKSLVVVDAAGAEPRFGMLATIRRYAGDRLDEAGEAGPALARHARWFVSLAERAEPELTGPDQLEWLARLDADHDNLRAALQWAATTGEHETALRMASALVMFWRARGHFSEGLRFLDASLAAEEEGVATPAAAAARATAAWGRGFMALMLGGYAAAQGALQYALEGFRSMGDARGEARCLLLLANVREILPGPRSVPAILADSVALARRVGDTWCLVHALTTLAWELDARGEPARAGELIEEALDLARRSGDIQSRRIALAGAGSAALGQGAYDVAEVLLGEALTLVEELDEDYETAFVLCYLAAAATGRGDWDRAASRLASALPLARRSGNPGAVVECLVGLGDLARALGERHEAGARFAEALECARSIGGDCPAAVIGLAELSAAGGDRAGARASLERVLAAASLPRPTARALYALGELARSEGDHDLALARHQDAAALRARLGATPEVVASLEAIAGVAAEAGRPHQSARLLGAAESARAAGGFVRPPVAEAAYARTLAAVRMGLPPEEVDAAFTEGAGLSVDEAVVYACRGRRSEERATTGWEALSRAERDVAALVGASLTNAEIAERLFMSLGTVKTHLSRIFAKLGVRSRREVAREALRHVDGGANK